MSMTSYCLMCGSCNYKHSFWKQTKLARIVIINKSSLKILILCLYRVTNDKRFTIKATFKMVFQSDETMPYRGCKF